MNRPGTYVVSMALAIAVLTPAEASAERRLEAGQTVGLISATVAGGAIGLTTGFLGAGGLAAATCTSDGFGCIGPVFGSALLGGLTLGAMGAGASWLGVASTWERRHDTGNVLVGAGVGLLAGSGAALAVALPAGVGLFDEPGLLALPVLGASVGGIIGYALPANTTVAVTPRADGGAWAHLGFTF